MNYKSHNLFLGMRMADPVPTFSYLISKIKDKHPNLAYIHSIEARVIANYDVDAEKISDNETNDTFRKIWGERPFITNGGFKTSDDARIEAEEAVDLSVKYKVSVVPLFLFLKVSLL